MTEEHKQEMTREEKARLLQERLKMGFNLSPFNNFIGLQVMEVSETEVRARFEMRPELVGNVTHSILHGGVIATALDTAGGAMGMVAAYGMMKGLSREEKLTRMTKLGTIDMRVDYLQPGRGQWFEAIGRLSRAGKKVLFTRMELINDKGDLIATGNATYMY